MFIQTKISMKKMAVALAISGMFATGAAQAATELISNGGFESGLAGWSCTGADLCTAEAWFSPHAGSLSLIGYDNSGYGTLSQTISTTVGASYDFSFFSAANQVAGNALGYSFSDYSNAVFAPITTSWAQSAASFIANSSSTNIQFYFSTVMGTGTVWIDDVSVQHSAISAVPEPETYGMLLAGLGLLGFMARRRKNNAA